MRPNEEEKKEKKRKKKKKKERVSQVFHLFFSIRFFERNRHSHCVSRHVSPQDPFPVLTSPTSIEEAFLLSQSILHDNCAARFNDRERESLAR